MSDFVFAAKLSDLAEGTITAVYIDETPVALTRVGERVFAFGNVCTHDDGPLHEGHIEDNCAVCPRHGARFDLITGQPTFPAVARIPIYEVKVEQENVLVKL
ncbi:MAG: Rieske (2Fe-2S) protein [Thermoflexales bacterium]